jgi:hypothetical protein
MGVAKLESPSCTVPKLTVNDPQTALDRRWTRKLTTYRVHLSGVNDVDNVGQGRCV